VAVPFAIIKKLGSTVFFAKVMECVFMKESKQHVLFAKDLQYVVIQNNAVNVKIAHLAISQKNVLMVHRNHTVGIAEAVNIVNMIGSDACVRIVMVVLCAYIISQ